MKDAVLTLLNLLTAANTLIAKADAVSRLIQKAGAEGRDVSPDELDALAIDDDAARAALAAAIAKAKGGAP